MTGVITRSPFIMAHPEYWGLLTQPSEHRLPDDTREVVELYIRVGRRVVWTSGEMTLLSLPIFDAPLRFYARPDEKLSAYLKYHRLFPTPSGAISVRVRDLSFPPPNKRGEVTVTVRGSDSQYRTAIQTARRATFQSSRSPWNPRGNPFPLKGPAGITSPIILSAPIRTVIENYDGPTGTYTLNIGSFNDIYKYRSWTPNPTPNFGKLKKSALPVNNYSLVLRETQENVDVNHSFVPSNGSYHTEIHSWRENLPGPDLPNHLDAARFKAIRDVIEQAKLGINANLAQDAAQVHQLTDLIQTTCSRLIGGIMNLRRGNIAGAINHLTAGRTGLRMPKGRPNRKKDLAENWLELQYGWKPLLMDVEGVLENLSNLNIGSPTIRRVVGRGMQTAGVNNMFDTYTAPTIGPGKGTEKRRISTKCRIGIVFSMESPLLSFLAQTGFTNPINLVWEILPFSFVADWFISIGPYLEALSAWDGLTFHDGYQTQFTKMWTTMSVDYDGINVSNPSGFWTQTARLQLEDVKFDRLKLSGFPSQTFPQFKNPFGSVVHAWNAIALLGTFFRR